MSVTRAERPRPTVRGTANRVFRLLPESLRLRWFPSRVTYRATDVPPPVTAPEAPVRLYIAPENSAGQGWAWARAAEQLPGVRAVDMQYRGARHLGYPADTTVPSAVVAHSDRWGRAQYTAVAHGFTHVVMESQRPIFGRRFRGDVGAEVAALVRAGVGVASLCHGSDIRLPSRHRAHEPDSPFHDTESDLTRRLQSRAERAAGLLDEIDGPEFVSTPDLLLDRPHATWLPVVVDLDRWSTDRALFAGDRPVAIHAPSNAGLKGTEFAEPVLRRLDEAGDIEYRAIERTPAERMPAIVHDADIVIDQFSLGIYGVAACEAMAAGRLVVSHVSEFVRDTVRDETGLELPIVEATLATLEQVLRDIRDRPEHYRERAAAGPAFVAAVHDGRRSAAALAPFLGVAPV
ncbi:hypothetical protein [Agromyces italicus]|uniref:hypothetical protein n=1 Tax=Agromyces italicus TaxID=279572 RepID=UPI0012F87991|nr:hypothetical protein [Agromyces italicus]